MIDWLLFVLLMGSIGLIAWGSYREGVEEGWRQAGRWAEDMLSVDDIEQRTRPATRLDDDGNPPYSIL